MSERDDGGDGVWRPRPADSMRESVSERVLVASTTSIPYFSYDGGDGVWRPRPDSGNASKCERVKESKRATTTSTTTRVPFINYNGGDGGRRERYVHRLRPERGNGREREAAAEGEQRLVNRSLEVSLELVSAMNLLPNLLPHQHIMVSYSQ